MDFDPQQLRGQLPYLFAPHASEVGPAVQAYRRFYRLPGDSLPSRLGHVLVDGQQLAVQAWWPPQPRASMLLLHGYYDHMGLYRHLIDWALAHDFAVLACDLPGHGLSEGTPASIQDFRDYQQVLHALFDCAARLQLPRPWHLFGQSTGAAIILDHLLHDDPVADGRTVLLSPLIRPCQWPRIRFTWPLLHCLTDRIERIYMDNSSDPAFLDFVRRDPLQVDILPLDWVGALRRWVPRIEAAAPSRQPAPLLVQGDADRTVEWQHNLALLEQKFEQPPRLLLPGARHHLVNESAEQRRRMFSWLATQLH